MISNEQSEEIVIIDENDEVGVLEPVPVEQTQRYLEYIDFSAGILLGFYSIVSTYARGGDCYSKLFNSGGSIIGKVKYVTEPFPQWGDWGDLFWLAYDLLLFAYGVYDATATCISQYQTAATEDWISNYQRRLTMPNWLNEILRFEFLLYGAESAFYAYTALTGDKEVAAFRKGGYISRAVAYTFVWVVSYFSLDGILQPMDPWDRYIYFTL